VLLSIKFFGIGTIAWIILLCERLISGKRGVTTFQGSLGVLVFTKPFNFVPMGAIIGRELVFWTYCLFPLIYLYRHFSKKRELPKPK
jgi:hypothetical protein